MSDFGPRITIRIVERLRDDIMSGKLKSGSEIKVSESKLCTLPYMSMHIDVHVMIWGLLGSMMVGCVLKM